MENGKCGKRSLCVGQASLFEGGGPKGRREGWQCDRFSNGTHYFINSLIFHFQFSIPPPSSFAVVAEGVQDGDHLLEA